jgi:hypothetical protein
MLMEIPLSGVGLGLLILAVVVGSILRFALDIGLGLASDELWVWIGLRRTRRPRFPWSDRTGG